MSCGGGDATWANEQTAVSYMINPFFSLFVLTLRLNGFWSSSLGLQVFCHLFNIQIENKNFKLCLMTP